MPYKNNNLAMIFFGAKTEIKAIDLLQVIRNMMNYGNFIASIKELPSSLKKTATADNLQQKDKKNEKAHSQKQHICNPHNPTLNQSLQKNCFYANALAILIVLCNLITL